MKVTIITDASYCPNTRVAGYGFWIASQRGKLGGGAAMEIRGIVHNVAAEMMAVANSLFVAINKGLVCHGDEVLMQTDCEAAIQAFRCKRINLSQQEQSAVDYVDRTCWDFHLKFDLRHVKGHSRNPEARFVANHMCDKQAKDAMRSVRNRIYINQMKESILGKSNQCT